MNFNVHKALDKASTCAKEQTSSSTNIHVNSAILLGYYRSVGRVFTPNSPYLLNYIANSHLTVATHDCGHALAPSAPFHEKVPTLPKRTILSSQNSITSRQTSLFHPSTPRTHTNALRQITTDRHEQSSYPFIFSSIHAQKLILSSPAPSMLIADVCQPGMNL